MRESSGYYTARNGSCYGRYQLLISYLGGDPVRKNQNELPTATFDGPLQVHGRAKRFWLAHNCTTKSDNAEGESVDSPFFYPFSSFFLFQKVIPFYLFYKSNLCTIFKIVF